MEGEADVLPHASDESDARDWESQLLSLLMCVRIDRRRIMHSMSDAGCRFGGRLL